MKPAADRLVREDTPAGALGGRGGLGQLGLELGEGAEGLGDRVREVTDAVGGQRLAAAPVLRAVHVVPVDGVEDVAGEVEGQVLLQAVDRAPLVLVARLLQLLQGVVRSLDVRGVVLVVVQLDDLRIDHRLQRRVVVRQLRKCVDRHVPGPFNGSCLLQLICKCRLTVGAVEVDQPLVLGRS